MVSATSCLLFAGASAFAVRLVLAISSRRAKRLALHKVPGPPSASFLTGNLAELNDAEGAEFLERVLREYGPISKLHGIGGDTVLCTSDPQALSYILQKEADSFDEVDLTGTTVILEYMFGPGLVSTNGPRHRRQRRMLNPLFSTAHMRRSAPLIHSIAMKYRDYLLAETEKSSGTVDIAPGLARLALEIISQVGFGHSFRALDGGSSDYIRASKEILPSITACAPFIIPFVASGLSSLPPSLLRAAGTGLSLVFPALQSLMSGVDTIFMHARRIWEAKKAAFASGDAVLKESVMQGGDLLSVLLKENALAKGVDKLPDDELLAQLNTLIVAGAESTSTAVCCILYHLALDPKVQDSLRAEIIQAGEDLGYDALMNLPLLDAVCRETMRKHAFFPYRSRLAMKAAVIPFTNGESIYVPAGTEVVLSNHGLNTDPAIWGVDAHEWRPERWLEPLPESVAVAKIPGVYSNSTSFGSGPKSCIGYTLAVLEMKSALAVLLPSFAFDLPVDHEIVWRSGITISPSVKGDKGYNATMPVQIKCLDGANA
ncbi:cytochrome P450 [Peniophora sp. CONT]|nr:cytochrome P450 [Peniophora sp. CONT]